MLVFTEQNSIKEFEKMSHQFAQNFGLPRHHPYEVFDCDTSQEEEFLTAYKTHIESKYIHRIEKILTSF